MTNWLNLRIVFLMVIFLTTCVTGIAQEAEVVEVVRERPMYERFGMTSTQLFVLMLSFTLVLIFVLVGLTHSLKNIAQLKINKKLKNSAKTLLILVGLFSSFNSFGADGFEQQTFSIPFPDDAFWMLATLDIALILVILYFAGVSKGILYEFAPKKKRRWAKRFNKTVTDVVPIEDEESILMDHDYDGIKELDNNLPPWWKWGFYVTIVWAVAYFAYYMVPGGGLSQKEEFEQSWEEGLLEVAQYKADHPELVTAESAKYLTDANTLGMGSSIFTDKCVTCHKAGGAGESGPNLTDDYWINGQPTMENIFNIISNGAANGMKAWKNELNGVEIQAVASYVLSLEPLLPPEGQEPKGEYYSPDLKEKPASADEGGEEADQGQEWQQSGDLTKKNLETKLLLLMKKAEGFGFIQKSNLENSLQDAVLLRIFYLQYCFWVPL